MHTIRRFGWLFGPLVLMAALLSAPVPADAGVELAVFSIGDSIFNYSGSNEFGTELPLALSSRGMVSSGIDANSGRSITANGATPSKGSGLDAIANNAAAIASSDILLTNLSINNPAMGDSWRAQTLQFISAARAVNPTIIIAWITPVAEPGVAAQYLVDRGVDHAATVRSLANDGLIELAISWDVYAVAHPNVFHTDGIHYWVTGDVAALANFAAGALDDYLGGTTTTTTTAATTTTTAATTTTTAATTTTTAATTTTKPTTTTAATTTTTTAATTTTAPATTTTKPTTTTAATTTTTRPATTTTAPATTPPPATTTTRPADLAPIEAEVHRLYSSVFDRPSDPDGLSYWADLRRQGLTIFDVADNFTTSLEWTNRYGNTLTDTQVIDALYANVLARTGDQEGREYWATLLQRGLKRSELVVYFTNSRENVQRTGTVS